MNVPKDFIAISNSPDFRHTPTPIIHCLSARRLYPNIGSKSQIKGQHSRYIFGIFIILL